MVTGARIQYPQIVGHEIAGEVVAIGSSVTRFDVGSRVGVGTMVDSCRHCPECLRGAKTTARTVILRLMARKTVTDLLLKAAIRNSSSLLKISSSVFRIQSISRKRVHCCVPVLRPIHPFAIGVLLLVRTWQLRV